jgi:hypothetical protein
MKTLVSVAIALAMAGSAVAARANGTILLSRPVDGVYQGTLMKVGSGLFTIHNDGTHLKQLTPWVANSYYLPSGVAYYSAGGAATGYFLTRNFAPGGGRIQYFHGESSDPRAVPYAGKYRVMNLGTGDSYRVFPGSNDNAPPGYGYLAWGPAGTHLIAYTNSTSNLPVDPHCVFVMHPDGSARRQLWCAPEQESTPQGMVPTLAVEGIRWAGNGKSLLAFVSYRPVPLNFARPMSSMQLGGTGYAALYKVDVQTGVGKEIATNNPEPVSADLSYDGTKVVYQPWDGWECGNTNPEDQEGISVCELDQTTGQVTTLLGWERDINEDWEMRGLEGWSGFFYVNLLLSPSGSKLAISMDNADQNESDLYVVNSDGTNLRQLTHRDAQTPAQQMVAWVPVAWSADGNRLLANRGTIALSSTDGRRPSDVHIINLATGKNRCVTSGYAVDWFEDTKH